MKNKAVYAILAVIAVLVIAAVASVKMMNARYNTVTEISEVKSEAEKLYSEGDLEGAIEKMEAYCAHSVTDIEAAATLGDWYLESGDEEKAIQTYYSAAQNKSADDADAARLNVKNTSAVLTAPIQKQRLEITADVRMTKNMTLTISNGSIPLGEPQAGRIDKDEEELVEESRYLTTEWFDVDPAGEYLTLFGGFNCAHWQYRKDDGTIIYSVSNYLYNSADEYGTEVHQMSRVSIPDNAVSFRVTYYDFEKEETTAGSDFPVTIVYGQLPTTIKKGEIWEYEIPDLKEGEKIVLDDDTWTFVSSDGSVSVLDWEAPEIEYGSYMAIEGDLPGIVDYNGSDMSDYAKNGIYTIKFSNDTSEIVGEREDDAKGLHFNAANGNTLMNAGGNDFDNIYPWSEIKLCAIKDGKIIYDGETGFATNGSAGDVFVEIPKFYSRRVEEDGYEIISISGELHEGFELDEAFVTEGGELDAIYIAAYLSSENEDGLAQSVSGEMPMLNVTAEDVIEAAEGRGEGYHEIDYAALAAVQKLFMVETGMRNSQALFSGICNLTEPSIEGNSTYALALTDRSGTNVIVVSTDYEFSVGDNVIIFEPAKYDTAIDDAIDDVRQVTSVIDNGDDTQMIYFSGETMNISEGKHALAHIALKTGTTNVLNYPTASENAYSDSAAFRYRYMENIWGNVNVLLDSITIRNEREITVESRSGESKSVSYSLPYGALDTSGAMIKSLGVDEDDQSVMLPAHIGNGASSSTYYGDTLVYDYDYSDTSGEAFIWYGGAWHSLETGGLFSYRACSASKRNLSGGGRLMYIKTSD
ncbi:MAG: tetratricopeptide repeat protein [Clostridia bacterium]|nr:tetratricopeptide repeat protein [Clostridia bacterium]